MPDQPRYQRILLKLSGEALAGEREYGLDLSVVQRIAKQVQEVHTVGVAAALLVGGGNIFRGIEGTEIGFDRSTGDYMGMLATVINALALQEGLEQCGMAARTMSAIEMPKVAEPFIRRRAMRHMEKGRVVILAGGTGNPYMSTDTAAALRAAELECEVMMKATRVDGVYSADPKRDPAAVKIRRLDYLEVLNRGLGVMDSTAVTLCSENQIPIVVFDLLKEGNMMRVVLGEEIGTLVGPAQGSDHPAAAQPADSPQEVGQAANPGSRFHGPEGLGARDSPQETPQAPFPGGPREVRHD